MKHLKLLPIIVGFAASVVLFQNASSLNSSDLNSTAVVSDVHNWLTQKICVDNHDVAVAGDPFVGCSANDHWRPLEPTDALPYLRRGFMYGTSPQTIQGLIIPTRAIDGHLFYVLQKQPLNSSLPNTTPYRPTYDQFSRFEIGEGTSGWVSAASTRDPIGFNTVFYGVASGEVVPENGWILFPLSFVEKLTSNSTTSALQTAPTTPIFDDFWEHNGEPGIGTPPPASQWTPSNMINSYQYVSNFEFGTVNPASRTTNSKRMNTLIAYHQPTPTPSLIQGTNPGTGHMEVLYFTTAYGWTRWSAYAVTSCAGLPRGTKGSCALPPDNCTDSADGGPGARKMNLNGTTYYRISCTDFSQTVQQPGAVPYFPVPEANLLSDSHFAGSASSWLSNPTLQVASKTSTTPIDTQSKRGRAFSGVKYAELYCPLASCQNGASIYQNIDIEALRLTSGRFGFGISARVHPGSANSGVVQVSLYQVGAQGQVLSTEASQSFTLEPGVAGYGNPNEVSAVLGDQFDSVVLESQFVSGMANITIHPQAKALRLRITPQTGIDFDLVEAHLSRLSLY
jgi:hypothetical protein